MEKKKQKYNFNEKEEECIDNKNLPVWQSPAYKNSKDKVIEILDSGKYDLKDSDFWILMNKTRTGKVAYTGLIISHNGCLKINEKLDNPVKPNNFTIDKEGYNNSLVIQYVDEDVCEFGEFSTNNCKNAYPYAMAYKRCFDRVVLKKSRLAYSGVYSDSEAEEFKNNKEDEMIEQANLLQKLRELVIENNIDEDAMVQKYKVDTLSDLNISEIKDAIKVIENWKTKKEGK